MQFCYEKEREENDVGKLNIDWHWLNMLQTR